jgi:peptidyl-prolyl cis-trans isomerase C
MSFPLSRIRALSVFLGAFVLIAGCGGKEESRSAAPAAAPPPAAAAAAVSATPPEPKLPPATVLAKVDSGEITAGDVIAALDAMPAAERRLYAETAALRDLVERLADRPLMAAAARAANLDQDPVMQQMLAQPIEGMTADQMLAEVWLETELAGAAPLAPDAVEQYYAANMAEFNDATGKPQPVDAVRDAIRSTLERARRDAALATIRDRLRKGGSITVDDKALAAFYGAASDAG